MATATTSLRLYQLDKLHGGNRNRFFISVCNTCRISWNSTGNHGYCNYVHSSSTNDRWRGHRTIRMEVNSGNDHPPEQPEPAPRRSSSFLAWTYGAIITIFTVIIPLLTSGKWGPVLALKRKMDSTLERVEEVTDAIEDVAEFVDEITDKVTENLPDDSRLKYVLDKLDDAAEQTIKATDFAQEILEKVEDIGDTMEAIEILVDNDRIRDKKAVDVEKNMEKVIQKLNKKIQSHEKKIADMEEKMEKITKELLKK